MKMNKEKERGEDRQTKDEKMKEHKKKQVRRGEGEWQKKRVEK